MMGVCVWAVGGKGVRGIPYVGLMPNHNYHHHLTEMQIDA